jgi:hypothetical protein
MMMRKTRLWLLAGVVAVAPLGAAMAQQDSTSGGTRPYGNASPTTAPNNPQMNRSSSATDPRMPGATGETVVPGSGSSMAGSDRVAPNPNSGATTAGGGMGGH